MDEARLKSERSEALEVVEYDSSDHDSVNRYLFHDRLTPECSILSQIGWTMSNIHHHSIDDPFSDFATSSMPKSEANISGVDGFLKIADTRPSISAANMSCGASGLVETVSTSNPSASSSSSDQDLVEKSIGFGETAQPSLQIPSSKSKKKEQKRIRQPRIAFVTKSEVDHLEDGYRWRKYGQKAVKNSPYPRSYYRCTNMKCTVKKRVERSREDPTTVVTTYEGQHCHQTVAFPRGAGLSIRETVLGGKIGPPNSQFYYPGMQHLPRQSPHAGIASNTQPTSVPDQRREASRLITCNEPRLPAAPDCSAQLPSNEGLLEDVVSPRRRNLHP